ncbi:dihydropteroate synthase [uncultured Desulfobacter sp.]|uniref:dihydropteroate synthase n=1 Tax=uncultured Desulfobacter sp. TaxID=240139 RepID=UPI002AAB231C|nr:dihydropteroate synthase [uncultured Desulfobacter sp.]
MIIVGELINATRKAVQTAIETKDGAFIRKLAQDQAGAGAAYIDANAGVFRDKETGCLKWVIDQILDACDIPVCVDSPNPEVLDQALNYLSAKTGTPPMINSISLETDKLEAMLPMVSGSDFKIIALCMNDKGTPATVDERLSIADALINKLIQANVKPENIYVDPLVQAISTNVSFGTAFLDTIEKLMDRHEGIHTMCGLSNISFGMPARGLMNRTFMAMAVAKGLDGAIANPLDQKMMAAIVTAEALACRDGYCMNYLKAFRAGML